MLDQLLIGTLLIFLTVVVQVLFLSTASNRLTALGDWLVRPPFLLRTTVALVAVVLWLMAGISVSVWFWAGALTQLGAFSTLETSLYFAIVTFTTVGYGDVTVSSEWRILAGVMASNGLLIFGLNTAFLVEFANRLRPTD